MPTPLTSRKLINIPYIYQKGKFKYILNKVLQKNYVFLPIFIILRIKYKVILIQSNYYNYETTFYDFGRIICHYRLGVG